MAIVENLKVNVDVDGGAKSLKQLKAEFKETQTALEGLDASSKEYTATLKKLANTKDEIEDLNDAIKSQMGAGKFEAFSKVGSSIASGFAAATGAAALFGAKSEEVEQAMLKVQAAMALSDGLKGLEGLGDSLKNVGKILGQNAIIQRVVTAGQWLWNAALMANPIALVIAGVAALTAGIYFLVSALGAEKTENELVSESINKLIKARDYENERMEHRLKLDKLSGLEGEKLLKRNLEDTKLRIKNLDAQGEAFSKLTDATEEQNKAESERTKLLRKELDTEQLNYVELSKFRSDAVIKEEEAAAKKKADNEAATKEAREKRAAEAKEIAAKEAAIKAASAKVDEDYRVSQLTADQKSLEEFAKIQKTYLVNKNITQDEYNERIKAKKEQLDNDAKQKEQDINDAKAKQTLEDSTTEVYSVIQGTGADKIRTVVYKDGHKVTFSLAEEGIKEEKAKRQAAALAVTTLTLESTKQLNDGLQSMSDIYFTNKLSGLKKGSKEEEAMLRKQFEVNKKLQISSAVITGIQNGITAYGAGLSAARAGGAATAALAPFWGAAYAAISAVGSIAAIAKIKATQFGSSASTSTDTGGGNIGSFSQSGMNNGVNNTSTNLNANGTVNTPPVKVYVTQTDIHSANDTVEKIKTKALIE